MNRDILQNLFVGELFDFGQLLRIGGSVMREIEPKPSGIYYAAGLLDVSPEHFAAGCMQQVCSGMVAHGGVTQFGIHLGDDLIALLQRARVDYAMDGNSGRW